MTADWAELPYALLRRCRAASSIEVRGINRVTIRRIVQAAGDDEWELKRRGATGRAASRLGEQARSMASPWRAPS